MTNASGKIGSTSTNYDLMTYCSWKGAKTVEGRDTLATLAGLGAATAEEQLMARGGWTTTRETERFSQRISLSH